ncbi:MAG TPA: sugar transferase [Longimicrobiales bacterium]
MGIPALAREEAGGYEPPHTESADPPIVTSRIKRLIDVAGSVALLLVVALPALAIAIAIRLDSRGPAILRQPRCGYRGRPFDCLKFRSMRHDADEGPHRRYVEGLVTGKAEHAVSDGVFKLVADDRVTRVGRFLRRTSLDELPQLWNVMRGEMSLVGPRPPLPYEVELYDERQWGRLACKPGITGLWQVSGRNTLSYRDMCELDLEYIRNWSPWLDVRLLLRTLPVVLFNSGRAH